ncbi:MAG TPA: TetR family transcriptional regulator [Spirochaetia bacterium]|nr:MAG: hypothetical protein A2Y41_11665 [Spirochaetes bacterium GWB1_36_13]HCL56978.1 TetR family transcriptional regulator [Spirochaetia bacterium]
MNLTERQKEIIEASIKIISEKGIQKLTTRMIAEEMGMTEAALYRHFKNKSDIILSLLTQFEENVDSFFRASEKSPDLGLEYLRKNFRQRTEMLSSRPHYARVIFSEEIFQDDPRFAEKVLQIMEKHRSLLLKILSGAKEKKEIPDNLPLEQTALVIMGSFRLLVTRWKLCRFQFDIKEETEKILDFLLKKILQGEKL